MPPKEPEFQSKLRPNPTVQDIWRHCYLKDDYLQSVTFVSGKYFTQNGAKNISRHQQTGAAASWVHRLVILHA